VESYLPEAVREMSAGAFTQVGVTHRTTLLHNCDADYRRFPSDPPLTERGAEEEVRPGAGARGPGASAPPTRR